MPTLDRIRVMISSRCNTPFQGIDGTMTTLSTIRRELKAELEAERLLDNSPLFEVWINEEAPAGDGAQDLWGRCLDEVKRADIVLALYSGDSGWADEDGNVGICHAELHAGLSTAPAKIRLIALHPLASNVLEERHVRFREYVERQKLFSGEPARNAAELKQRCRETLREAVTGMVALGVRGARKGKFHSGDALEWCRLDFARRKQAMEAALREALLERRDSSEQGDDVFAPIDGRTVLLCLHAVPAALSVATAREMVGQPFLRDHECAGLLNSQRVGPVHLIACHRSVTESQTLKQLGFSDATVVTAPFGVYVVDDIQKIQLIFLANCRDESATRYAVQQLFEWLAQEGEDKLLSARADARRRIVQTIAEVAGTPKRASSRRKAQRSRGE